MRIIRKKNTNTRSLPTIPVGGELPSAENNEAIKKDLEEKTEKFLKENPQKPKFEEAQIDKPLEIKSNPFSIENEYIDMAKVVLGLPKGRDITLAEMAKAAITKITQLENVIKKLQNDGNNIFHKVYLSSENCSEWN